MSCFDEYHSILITPHPELACILLGKWSFLFQACRATPWYVFLHSRRVFAWTNRSLVIHSCQYCWIHSLQNRIHYFHWLKEDHNSIWNWIHQWGQVVCCQHYYSVFLFVWLFSWVSRFLPFLQKFLWALSIVSISILLLPTYRPLWFLIGSSKLFQAWCSTHWATYDVLFCFCLQVQSSTWS